MHAGLLALSLALSQVPPLPVPCVPSDGTVVCSRRQGYASACEALVVADNTLWSGRVLSPRSGSDRAIVAFNDQVALDSRVEKVLLPIREGVTLAWKR